MDREQIEAFCDFHRGGVLACDLPRCLRHRHRPRRCVRRFRDRQLDRGDRRLRDRRPMRCDLYRNHVHTNPRAAMRIWALEHGSEQQGRDGDQGTPVDLRMV